MTKKLMVLLVLAVLVAGCETTSGAGRDIENTGENIQEGVGDLTR